MAMIVLFKMVVGKTLTNEILFEQLITGKITKLETLTASFSYLTIS